MKRVILLGAGVSIKEGLALNLWEKIESEEIWSLNFAFMTMPYLPQRELWIDMAFFRNNIEKLQELYRQGVLCYAKRHAKYSTIPEIKTYETTRNINEGQTKVFIGSMGLTGFFALHLACLEKYEQIYLLGYDFGNSSISNKNTHYYQNELINIQSTGVGHPELYKNKDGTTKPQVKDFEFFLQYPSKIYNVSLNSNINCFMKLSWNDFYNLIQIKKE